MKVSVQRGDPAAAEGIRFQDYEVPVPAENAWTVMDILDWISVNLDPSLAYYKHSVCRQGVCGRCLVKADGRTVLSCAHAVSGGVLRLEPPAGEVLRDLTVFPA